MTEYERGRAAGLAEAVKWHEEQIPRAKEIHDEAEKHFGLSGYARGYGELMSRATSTIAHHNEAIREIRALSPSPDHVLVPREPTKAMLEAALNTDAFRLCGIEDIFRDAYRAMIAEVK